MSATVKLQIDAEHTKRLLRGEFVAIKVPPQATQFSLRLHRMTLELEQHDSFAKQLDVFFNGRPA